MMEFRRLGEPLLDEYLRFVAARCRPNTLLAQSFDLKVFFGVVGKPRLRSGRPTCCVSSRRNAQPRRPRWSGCVDGEAGLSASTIKRRLATVAGLVRVPASPGVWWPETRCRGACRPGRAGRRCGAAR